MIAFLLNFILIIIFVAFIVVCVVAYRIYRSFHNIKKKFTSGFKTNADRQDNTWQNSGSSSWNNDETIIDRRSPDEANRKIFSKNEGEYIDFEEEK